MLHFDIDWRELLHVGNELQATDKQVTLALSRAMRRTEATLRRMSSQGLTKELQLRTAKVLRKRLRSLKMRMSAAGSAGQGMGLWYGLNDMPVGVFKGSPRSTASGASFRDHDFQGGFVGKSKISGRRSIFKRATTASLPIEEQLYPVHDKAVVFIEDQIFDQALEVFWNHFRRDLQARVRFSIGER